MAYKMYGIPNCDTVKKARKFLEQAGVNYEFIDFKKTIPKATWLKEWKKSFGELPVNKRGTTFRKIKTDYEGATESAQIKLLIDNASSIKRPILEKGNKPIAIGFTEADWKKLLK